MSFEVVLLKPWIINMNKILLLVLVGILSLSAQSCSSVSEFNDAKKELENNTAKPSSIIVNATGKKAEAEAEEEAEEETEIAAQVVGLVPATNPEIRVKGNVRGRQDPFSVITVQPQLFVEEVSDDKKSDTLIQKSPIDASRKEITSTPILEPAEPFVPTLAQNVQIAGLIEVDGRPKLIVQAPEETSSRYVEVGQYLSNGQILVKSIDMNHFPTPLVILEQSGVEVAKAIGEKTEEASEVSSSGSLPIAALTQ